jgi:hypothetical protein
MSDASQRLSHRPFLEIQLSSVLHMLPFASPTHTEVLTFGLRPVWGVFQNFLCPAVYRSLPLFDRKCVDTIAGDDILDEHGYAFWCLPHCISFMCRIHDQDVLEQSLLLSPHGAKVFCQIKYAEMIGILKNAISHSPLAISR